MNTHRNALRREAEDPATSSRRLAELAQQDPSLWEVIVRHPSCDPGYRDWILAQRPDLRSAAAAVPAASHREPALAVAPTRAARKRRGALPILAALGILALVFALGAGGTLWWVSRAEGDRKPATVADAENARPMGTAEASEEAVGSGSDEESADETGEDPEGKSASADVSTAPETTAPIEVDQETTGLETTETTEPDEPTSDGERIEGEEILVISSPSQNIGCELGGSYVGCTIRERDVDAVGCPDHATASFEIVEGASAMTACGVEYLGEVGDSVLVLEYGDSISFGGATCASESDGMTCWDDETGHSMTVSRSGVWLT